MIFKIILVFGVDPGGSRKEIVLEVLKPCQ